MGELGQTTGCPSPIWYILGGAVGWAVLGDVLKSIGGVGSKAAQAGLGHIERKIPSPKK